MLKHGIAAIALLAGTAGAYAAEGEEAQSDDDAVVCKTERVTGSRTKTQRICMTKKEWADLRAETRKGMEEFSRASGRNPPSSNPLGPN